MANTPRATDSGTEVPSHHWADHAAAELVEKHPGKKRFTCASGISPSGVVHIGNFREAFTTDLVVRALQSLGKETRFLYSWDDYDALRKIPANLPNPAAMKPELRKPLGRVSSPYGDGGSYAGHFEKMFEKEIAELGIRPEFLYQHERYESCDYAKGIATALENEKKIVEILNRFRTEPLPADWSCITVYSKATGKDTTTVLEWKKPTTIRYRCEETKQELEVDFAREPGVKLLWRVDWPMRWAHEQVDFEPGGKDHSSTGGSFETGCIIAREVYGSEPPHYVQYDFVLAKGIGSKLSSSSGNLITPSEALAIYEPAVLRYLFASRKPNLDFSIAFDLDVMKAYEDYDRCERYAYGVEPGEDKKVTYERRIYELSQPVPAKLGGPEAMPLQFPFRQLCNDLQIHEGNIDATIAMMGAKLKTDTDRARFRTRAERAWRWITEFAPPEFRFRIWKDGDAIPKGDNPELLVKLAEVLERKEAAGWSEDELGNQLREAGKALGAEGKVFFQKIYTALLAKTQGPKLTSLILTIGTDRAARIFRKGAGQ